MVVTVDVSELALIVLGVMFVAALLLAVLEKVR